MIAPAAVALDVATFVLANTYRDSVELMRVAAELEQLPGIDRAALVMASPANQQVLAAAELRTADVAAAGPNDLVVAVRGRPEALDEALDRAQQLLRGAEPAVGDGQVAAAPPRTLDEALGQLPGADLALISVPGPYATAEALKALKRGLDVFLFSDNVSLQDEIELKAVARRQGRLMMGPDCGTAILDGIPLGFANVVRRGSIGLIAASGTGLQEVACLVDRAGAGISQAIGVGGRDLDARVGGTMMLAALERLAADPETTAIVLISKPPAPEVAARVAAAARACGKPVVVNFVGSADAPAGLIAADTLEDAALAAVAVAEGRHPPCAPALAADLRGRAETARRQRAAGQGAVLGLFSGGTLAKEAQHVLHPLLADALVTIVDLGDDEYTVGRPHPMIDPRLRAERIAAAGHQADVAVVLFDVVLGYGSHPDPGGALVPALEAAQAAARGAGRRLALVASVCGTPTDPQSLAAQTARLEAAGVVLAPTNAQAAWVAALIAGAAE